MPSVSQSSKRSRQKCQHTTFKMENKNRENVQYLEEKLNRTMSELQQIKELLLKKAILASCAALFTYVAE